QHREGQLQIIGPLGGLLLIAHARAAAHGGDDGALLEEQVAHPDGLVEQPTGVAAQIEDQPLQPLLAGVPLELAQGLLHVPGGVALEVLQAEDRKSTRLNSSHVKISYAVCCLKKKT